MMQNIYGILLSYHCLSLHKSTHTFVYTSEHFAVSVYCLWAEGGSCRELGVNMQTSHLLPADSRASGVDTALTTGQPNCPVVTENQPHYSKSYICFNRAF